MRDLKDILRTWVNTELEREEANKLEEFLNENDIEYEASEAYNLIHIEVNVNEYERQAIKEWMEENIY